MKWKIPRTERQDGRSRSAVPLITLAVVSYPGLTDFPFVVDTGAELTSLTISLAREKQIPFEQTEQTRARAVGMVGAVDRFRGTLHLRIGGERFHWPCSFIASPNPTIDYGVLGRTGFLDEFHFCIGPKFLIIRRLWPSRPWWYRWLRFLFSTIARQHSPEVPL
jgi:hypothetical protein